MEKALQNNQENTSNQFAVLFLDIDKFKAINDNFGHEFGDLVLVAFAERLVTCVRPEDRVARLSGDEFIIILNPINSTQEAKNTANRIVTFFNYPLKIKEHQLTVKPSIGVVIANNITNDYANLLPNADFAMYQSKILQVPFVVYGETILDKCLEIQEDLQRFQN